jgi:hypothetical protein
MIESTPSPSTGTGRLRGSSTTVDMSVDEENNKGGQPKH